jgi:hypothetical protein
MAKRVITIPATLSYPHFDKAIPPKNGKGDPKFSGAFLFIPNYPWLKMDGKTAGGDTTPEQVLEMRATLWAALLEAAEEVFGNKAAGMMKSGALKTTINSDWEKKNYPEGTIYINARGSNQPGLVYPWAGDDGKAARVPQEKITEVFYPGAKVIASVTAFYFDNESKGVSFGLNNVQVIGKGPRLDNQKSAQDEFTADAALTPADLATLEG